MKLLQTSIVAALLALSTQAQAYSVDHGNTYAVGTATISATNMCKFKQQYENAEFGNVYDGEDALGAGLVSSSGQLLALADGEGVFVSGIQTSKKYVNVVFVDMVNEVVSNVIGQSTGSEPCGAAELIVDAKSHSTSTYSAQGMDLEINVQFDGIAEPKGVATQGAFVYKKQIFSGKITFKGKANNAPI